MFRIGDKIVTSKGRFGIIESSDDERSAVKIGNKLVFIANCELLLLDTSKAIEIEYYLDFIGVVPLKEIVYINKKITVFDINKPLDNNILSICQKKLETKLETKQRILISKLNLV